MRDLSHLSDDELLSQMGGILASQRNLLARLLCCLREVEERRLHLRLAYSSMFDFCTRKLGMTEGEAYRRIAAARMARRYPTIIGLVESGAIRITSLMLLRDHLTSDNSDELLQAASGKDKSQVEELVAARFPRPDAPDAIRKLPAKEPPPPAAAELPFTPRATAAPKATATPPPVPHPPPAKPSPRLQPLSAGRYKVQFTADAALKDKIERARRLLSHEDPNMELAAIMGRALDAFLIELEKKKRARTDRPRRGRPSRSSATITNQTRREVVERDGDQCTFVGEDGRRCEAKACLQFDHIDPRACGGTGDGENVRLLCREHNRFAAEQIFGKEHIAERIKERRERATRRAPQAPSNQGQAASPSADPPAKAMGSP